MRQWPNHANDTQINARIFNTSSIRSVCRKFDTRFRASDDDLLDKETSIITEGRGIRKQEYIRTAATRTHAREMGTGCTNGYRVGILVQSLR